MVGLRPPYFYRKIQNEQHSSPNLYRRQPTKTFVACRAGKTVVTLEI